MRHAYVCVCVCVCVHACVLKYQLSYIPCTTYSLNIWVMVLTSKVNLVLSNAEFQQSKYNGGGQLMLCHLADGRSKTAVVERSVDGTKLIVT